MNYFSEYEIFGSLFLPVSIDLHHESDVEPLKDHLLSAGYGDRFLSDFRSEAVFVFKVFCDKVTVDIVIGWLAGLTCLLCLKGILVLLVITTTQCSPCSFRQERGP